MAHINRYLITITLIVSLCSCSTFQSVSSNEKLADNSQAIRVTLRDNRKIEFASGAYTINSLVDSAYITGHGTLRKPFQSGTSHFEGIIDSRNIKELEVAGIKSFPMMVIPLVAIAVLVTGLVIMGQ